METRGLLEADPSEANLEALNGQFRSVENLTEDERKHPLVMNQDSIEESDLAKRIRYQLGCR